MLGAGTVLAPRDDDPGGANRLRLDGEEPRLLTLLSVAYGRPVDASILGTIRRASKRWSAGEDCLAAMHLALAGLRKLDDARDAARRLFIADGLMADGVAPRDIWTALEFDPTPLDDLEKLYNPNEARNPKGDGDISGRWASGETKALSKKTRPKHSPSALAPVPRVLSVVLRPSARRCLRQQFLRAQRRSREPYRAGPTSVTPGPRTRARFASSAERTRSPYWKRRSDRSAR